jgi:hypothetical protein
MRRIASIVLVSVVVLYGCVTAEDLPPIMSTLDQQSGVTVEATGVPYVLAHEAAALAANARDYLDMRVLEVDRMGKRSYYLSLVAFSTVARRGDSSPTAQAIGKVRVRIGSEATDLEAVREGEEAYGLSARVFPRRNGYLAAADYAVTPAFVRALAAAGEHELSIEVGADADLVYEPWEPAIEGLKGFAERLPRSTR